MEYDAEKLKNSIKILAKKASVDEATVEKLFSNFCEDQRKRGVTDEAKIEQKALLRIQASLKKKLRGTSNIKYIPGFIMSRGRAYDNSRKQREEAIEYVREHGLEAAIEEGYANAGGEYLYVDYDWRKGKKIPEFDWRSSGLAMIEAGEGEIVVAEVNYRNDAAIKPLELFKICDIPVYIREKGDVYKITISNEPKDYRDEYVDYLSYEDKIKTAFPGKVVGSLKEVEDFYLEHSQEYDPWCIFKGNISGITTTTKTQSTVLQLDDMSLSINNDGQDVESVPVILPKEIKVDCREDAVDVVIIGTPALNDDGSITVFGTGFWCDAFERVDPMETDTNVEEPWG